MKDSLTVAGLYFHRMAQKPLLLILLLAIPLTLVLAEFAAFGHPPSSRGVSPISIRFFTTDHSPLVDRFTNCLAKQAGHPIQEEQTESSSSKSWISLSQSGTVKVLVFSNDYSEAGEVLTSSIAKLCFSEISQTNAALYPIAVVRGPKEAGVTSISTSQFAATFFPGLALFGALFISQSMASLVWRDYDRHVQQRLLTTPVHASALLSGPLLFLAAGTSITLLLILGMCAYVTGPSALLSPAFLATVVGFSICASSLQLTTGLIAKSPRASQAISASTNMVLAFLGGGFVPLSLYPPFLHSLALVLPNGAGQAGLSLILAGSGSTQEVTLRVLTVWAWAVTLTMAAVFWQSRRLQR